MNSDAAGSRWVKEFFGLGPEASPPTDREIKVLAEVLQSIRGLDFGTVHLTLQDARVVQIEVTRKKRL